MQWNVISQSRVADDLVVKLTEVLKDNSSVVLLVSGGSAIDIEVAVLIRLSEDTSLWSHIHRIIPVDERYGSVGHINANMPKLMRLLPENVVAKCTDVLQGLPFDETVETYAEIVEDAVSNADYIVALLGMGADGHTAGILPRSPASSDDISTVVGYNWTDFTRMTIGARYLRKIDQAFMLVYGESKKLALERLQRNTESFEDLPAKILYHIPSVTVYNEYIDNER